MAVKQWNPGDVLTASDMNAWTVDLAAYVTSAQHFANNTLVYVTQLVLPFAVTPIFLLLRSSTF